MAPLAPPIAPPMVDGSCYSSAVMSRHVHYAWDLINMTQTWRKMLKDRYARLDLVVTKLLVLITVIKSPPSFCRHQISES